LEDKKILWALAIKGFAGFLAGAKSA